MGSARAHEVSSAPATVSDAEDWLAMRTVLWPEGSLSEHRAEIKAMLSAPGETITFIARNGHGAALGFIEAAVRRDYVNGCETSPVAFVEGIFVLPSSRGRGVARALIASVEQWGREQGCSELASDTAPDNLASQSMHKALGFVETERVVFFKKLLA
ncbi:MAG: aminoglycoside 6'-acetyltransferase [Pelagibacterium sp. SCN 63-23]|nr:MAG: aminoglycoside 6'-acetyltransferase [Pelagibacterium sp. SCN 63-23]